MSDYYPEVVQAVAGPDRTVYAYFSDGKIVQYDVAPLIFKGSVFEPLESDSFFKDALTVLNGTVAWDRSGHFDPTTCLDVDPFTVYESAEVSDPLGSVA